MKTVWKFSFPIDDRFVLDLPIGAKPLCIMVQHDRPRMWVLVDRDTTEYETRWFRLAGTGHQIKDSIKCYVGSFQAFRGDLVFHVFEIDKEKK